MDNDKRYCPYCGAPLATRENEGRARLYCRNEERFVYENPIPAATALVLNTQGRILLVLRNKEPGKNQWGLPGGFVETGESPAEAAKRELEEETGITAFGPKLIDVIYQESDFYRSCLLIIGYHFSGHEGEIRAGDDADEVRFFDPGELPELAFESHRAIIDRYLETRK